MKLERISENQIRCTLTRSDLAERELKLSELAYGTEKAKALFKEMMTQASDELGFEAENTPIIIEAVPISGECIMLIVTKVEDPEELDTRFSRFSPFADDTDDDADDDLDDTTYSTAEDILDIFKRLSSDILAKHLEQKNADSSSESPDDTDSSIEAMTETDSADPDAEPAKPSVRIRIYTFRSLDDVTHFSELTSADLTCGNTLYKNPANQQYYLVLSSESMETAAFAKLCQLASEFGTPEKASANTLYYYDEHYEVIIREQAIQILKNL